MSNDQCSINLAQSSDSSSVNDLYLNLMITFTSAFAGAKNVYETVWDRTQQNTGWVQVGTWTVGTPAVTVTVTSAPSGMSLTLDGAACTSPCAPAWAPNSIHTIAVASPQAGSSGTQYVYASWSDGGAQSHSITVPSSGATYSASLSTQYYLTTSASTGGSIGPASSWYYSGASVPVSATPNGGYWFAGFSGALTGTAAPQSVTVNGPTTVTANFGELVHTSSDLADFQACINPSTFADLRTMAQTCKLSPNRYQVCPNGAAPQGTPPVCTGTGPVGLAIGHKGRSFTIEGGGAPGDTVLVRASSTSVGSMMAATDPTVTNVTIQNLSFDGNRYGFGTKGAGISCMVGTPHVLRLGLDSF